MLLNRRDFLKASGITALSLTVTGCIDSAVKPFNKKKPAKQPNFLWISCEDISSHLGCYGEYFAITPNIDQFAKESVRYTQAFTVHGVCAPSRSGIISGMYPSSLGSCNMRCSALKPDSVKCFPQYLRDAGYYCTNNSKEDYNFKTPKEAWDQSDRVAHWKNRPQDKPFFAVFNFGSTHESSLWNSADFDNTHPKQLKQSEWQNPDNMKIPPIYPDTPVVRRDFARLFERITQFDYFLKKLVDELKQAGLYEDTIIFIWSDHGNGLPRAKRWLYDSGTLVPLIIRIPKKFRVDRQGLPNTTDDQLVNFIDFGPSLLNLAGLQVPQYMQGQTFLGQNLPPERKYIFGARQRIDENYDMIRSVRDTRYRYIRNFNPFVPYLPYLEYAERCNTMKELRRLHAEGKLNKIQAQWMADRRPAEELYDLKNDPWETTNLADDPEYANTKKSLQEVLSNWMIHTRDTGLLPEPLMTKLAKEYGSEMAIFQQPDSKTRIQNLLQLAIIASKPKPSDASAIYTALQSDDPALRYWAITALGQLKLQQDDDIQKFKNAAIDDDPSVRIVAARSLYWAGYKKLAVELLEEELKNTDAQEEVLHFAMDVLTTMGPDAKPALQAVERINEAWKNTKYINRIAKHLIETL